LEFITSSNKKSSLVGVVANDCNTIHWLPQTPGGKQPGPPYTRGWKYTRDDSHPNRFYHSPPPPLPPPQQQQQQQRRRQHNDDPRNYIENESDPYHGPPEHTLRPWLGSSFKTLRAQGAFLLSGSLSETGVIGDITIFAEKFANFTFLTPWPTQHESPVVRTDSGLSVEVVAFYPSPTEVFLEEGERLFRFATKANTSYILSAPKQ
jgi:hypothetical protein